MNVVALRTLPIYDPIIGGHRNLTLITFRVLINKIYLFFNPAYNKFINSQNVIKVDFSMFL